MIWYHMIGYPMMCYDITWYRILHITLSYIIAESLEFHFHPSQAHHGLHTRRHAEADQQYDEYEQYAAWVGNVGPFFWLLKWSISQGWLAIGGCSNLRVFCFSQKHLWCLGSRWCVKRGWERYGAADGAGVRMLLCEDAAEMLLCEDAAEMLLCEDDCCAIHCCGRCFVRMLLRDTLLRTLLCEDVSCAIHCCGRCCVRMLLRDTLLRTLLCEGLWEARSVGSRGGGVDLPSDRVALLPWITCVWLCCLVQEAKWPGSRSTVCAEGEVLGSVPSAEHGHRMPTDFLATSVWHWEMARGMNSSALIKRLENLILR